RHQVGPTLEYHGPIQVRPSGTSSAILDQYCHCSLMREFYETCHHQPPSVQLGVPALHWKASPTLRDEVIDITKIRDESLIISPQHMSASVPVGGATEIERVHYEDHNKEATSQPPSALESSKQDVIGRRVRLDEGDLPVEDDLDMDL
ncbi:hypothetical protein HAX54_037484, partial [Datura stramonium]|nr:hypothetical protein [Datura stramonium]